MFGRRVLDTLGLFRQSFKVRERKMVLKRYANVAHDLPAWAREALGTNMGSVVVDAKDSFEMYLLDLRGAVPKYDMEMFRKRFVEIFDRKAEAVLRKMIEYRGRFEDHYVANDYFWQEFRELFWCRPGINRVRRRAYF